MSIFSGGFSGSVKRGFTPTRKRGSGVKRSSGVKRRSEVKKPAAPKKAAALTKKEAPVKEAGKPKSIKSSVEQPFDTRAFIKMSRELQEARKSGKTDLGSVSSIADLSNLSAEVQRSFKASPKGRHLSRTVGRGGQKSSRIVSGGVQAPVAEVKGKGAAQAKRSMRRSSKGFTGVFSPYYTRDPKGRTVLASEDPAYQPRETPRERIEPVMRRIFDPSSPGRVKVRYTAPRTGPVNVRGPRIPKRRRGGGISISF
jgi:hypothetical protein